MFAMEMNSASPPSFPTGTSMVFQQSSAPTGWTKQTTHNDKAMRLVTGSVSSGGSSAFSTVFGKTATDSYTLLSPADIPGHAHSINQTNTAGTGNFAARGVNVASNAQGTTTVGSDGGHSHGMDIRVQYVDFIIANKD